MSNDERRLPVVNSPEGESEEPSCSPKIYISNEEAALLAEMRDLREASIEIRRKLETASGDDRADLETQLEKLRTRRHEVAEKRDQAYIRKMIMLGHLPPNHPIQR